MIPRALFDAIALLLGFVVVSTLFMGVNRWLTFRARNTARAAKEFALFQQHVKAVLSSDEVAMPVKVLVTALCAEAARPRFAAWVERQVRLGRVTMLTEESSSIQAVIQALPAEIRREYEMALAAALFSSASMHPFRADRIRSLLLLAAKQPLSNTGEPAAVTENTERVVGKYLESRPPSRASGRERELAMAS